MDAILERCAGLDVHQETIVACVMYGPLDKRAKKEIRDGYPIVGFHDQVKGLYLVAMHSAITLATFVSRMAANEIVENVRMQELESWRLSRFS